MERDRTSYEALASMILASGTRARRRAEPVRSAPPAGGDARDATARDDASAELGGRT